MEIKVAKFAKSSLKKMISYPTCFLIKTFWLGKTQELSNLPASACIIISNHESYLDFLLIGYSLKREANKNFTFWAKTKVVNHIIWKIYSDLFHSIEVNGNLRKVFELSQQAIINGEYVCIFPEGKRSRNGELQTFMKGYLRLASSLGIEIAPVFLENTYGAWPSHQKFPHFRKCNISFHPSIKVPIDLTEEELDAFNLTIMKKYEGFSKISRS